MLKDLIRGYFAVLGYLFMGTLIMGSFVGIAALVVWLITTLVTRPQ